MAELTQTSGETAPAPRGALAAAAILGFALGGFFDGILLHQVLQWHHFLSLAGEPYQDIRTQILADGLFHVAVYVITAIGLWLLWRSSTPRPDDRQLLGWALLGFGVWQFADVVIFHWIVGIHRIRVDVPDPLTYDIGWLVVFGVPALALGVWLLSKGTAGGAGPRSRAAVALSVLVVLAVPVSALPPATNSTLVMFRPGIEAAQSFAAIAEVDGRVVWADSSGGLIAAELPTRSSGWRLYLKGALLVGNSGALAGCLGWTRV